MNSALPKMVQPVSSEAFLSFIRGVLPMAWVTSVAICMGQIPVPHPAILSHRAGGNQQAKVISPQGGGASTAPVTGKGVCVDPNS